MRDGRSLHNRLINPWNTELENLIVAYRVNPRILLNQKSLYNIEPILNQWNSVHIPIFYSLRHTSILLCFHFSPCNVPFKTVYTLSFWQMHTTYPAYFFRFYLIIVIIIYGYCLWNSSLCNFLFLSEFLFLKSRYSWQHTVPKPRGIINQKLENSFSSKYRRLPTHIIKTPLY